MSEFQGTPHNQARVGDIAKTVLMPGDPLRAKFIADTFLENVQQFNSVRGMLGFTGMYKGVPVSVMGSGMGMPSIGIYSYELYQFYGVENIIRVGSAGAYVKELDLYDVVLADAAYSKSSYANCAFGYTETVMKPSDTVNQALQQAAETLSKPMATGLIHSGDVFYADPACKQYEGVEPLCVEMESFALFANARYLNKNAACMVTISDSFVTKQEASAAQRQTAFLDMMEIALNAAVLLSESSSM